MLKYTLKRVLYSALILFFVMFLIYVLMYNMPMGYVETKARELASRPGATKSYAEWLADLNAQYGMDKGVVMGYITWLKSALCGNWGDHWSWTIPVTQEFHNTVWYSFILGLVSFIFEILLPFRSESPRRKSSIVLQTISPPSCPWSVSPCRRSSSRPC